MAHKISFYHRPSRGFNQRNFWKCLALILIFALLMTGCKLSRDNNGQGPSVIQVLVSFEQANIIPISPQMVDQYVDLFMFLGVDISMIQSIQQYTQYDVNVYKVTYKTFYNGNWILASGAVIIPEVPEPPRILSFQSGTNLEDSKAPSLYPGMVAMGNFLDFAMPFAASGYICSVADYLGYGASEDIFHPYHHYSVAQTCLDMLRATVELCRQLNINFREEYFLCGYSEGGYSTLALQKKIQLLHREEFPIIASSSGAGAYDLYGTMRYYMNSGTLPYPSLPCFIIMAYHGIYERQRDLGEIFQSPYKERIESGLFDGQFSHEEIASQITANRDDLFTASFLADFNGNGEPGLKIAFLSNNLYTGWIPTSPTRLYQGTADIVIPPFNAEIAAACFHANGSGIVEYVTMPGVEHGKGFFGWMAGTIQWFSTF